MVLATAALYVWLELFGCGFGGMSELGADCLRHRADPDDKGGNRGYSGTCLKLWDSTVGC